MDKYHFSHSLTSEDYCELSAHKNKSENSHKFFAMMDQHQQNL